MRMPADRVEIRTKTGLGVVAHYGDDPPVLSGGVGGWEAVPRPGQRPLTVWRGVGDPATMTLSLLFDRWSNGKQGDSVEKECRILERLGGLEKDDPKPPVLTVTGGVIEFSMRGIDQWVLSGLEWGDSLRRASDGHRVRQAVTVTLMAFTEDDVISKIRAGSPQAGGKFATAKHGDTFNKIAASSLHSSKLGLKLAKLNGKRSATQVLKTGSRVKLPSPAALRDWQKK